MVNFINGKHLLECDICGRIMPLLDDPAESAKLFNESDWIVVRDRGAYIDICPKCILLYAEEK